MKQKWSGEEEGVKSPKRARAHSLYKRVTRDSLLVNGKEWRELSKSHKATQATSLRIRRVLLKSSRGFAGTGVEIA